MNVQYLLVGKNADSGVVSLHARLSSRDFGPALAHLINLCSSPSKPFAEYVMNFGICTSSIYG